MAGGGGIRNYFVQIRLLASRLGVAPDDSSIEYRSTVRPFIAGLPALRRSRFLFTQETWLTFYFNLVVFTAKEL